MNTDFNSFWYDSTGNRTRLNRFSCKLTGCIGLLAKMWDQGFVIKFTGIVLVCVSVTMLNSFIASNASKGALKYWFFFCAHGKAQICQLLMNLL